MQNSIKASKGDDAVRDTRSKEIYPISACEFIPNAVCFHQKMQDNVNILLSLIPRYGLSFNVSFPKVFMPNRESIRTSLMRLKAVQAQTGLARSTLYKLISEHTFPAPVRLTRRAVAWRSDSIDTWIASRTAA